MDRYGLESDPALPIVTEVSHLNIMDVTQKFTRSLSENGVKRQPSILVLSKI